MRIAPYELSLWRSKNIKVKGEVKSSEQNLLIQGTQIWIIDKSLIEPAGDYNENATGIVIESYNPEDGKVTFKVSGEVATFKTPYTNIQIEKNRFDEEKLAILATDNSTFGGKATNINFTRNINGMHTLTFTMPKKYYEKGELISNSVLANMNVKNRIKLKYKNKWYPFIINERTERREGKAVYFDFSCTDTLIYELSKNGYELSFDEDNGIGSIDELARKILYTNDGQKRTDWEYKDHYKPEDDPDKEEFLEKHKEYKKNEEGKYLIENNQIVYEEVFTETPISKYNEELERTIYQYEYKEGDNWLSTKDGHQVWGYNAWDIFNPMAAKNLLSNGENFTDTTNWESIKAAGETSYDYVSIITKVTGNIGNSQEEIRYTLKTKPVSGIPSGTTPWIVNSSIRTSSYDLSAETAYCVRIVYSSNSNLKLAFTQSKRDPTSDDLYYSSGLASDKCLVFKTNEVVNRPYFELAPLNSSSEVTYEKIQVFKVVPKDTTKSIDKVSAQGILKDLGLTASGNIFKEMPTSDFSKKYILPDDDVIISSSPVEEVIKLFYFTNDEEETGITYFYGGDKDSIRKLQKDHSQKIRTLQEEKSNYYNLLQSLAELFEGWIRFEVEYYDNGRVKRDKYGDELKFIQFREVVGKNQWAGFHYGVNISSIDRTINSDEITTKLWVENSESKRTNSGIISIADSELNRAGESYIYNFDYYMTIGEINASDFINDYMGTSSTDISYISKMEVKNEEYKTAYQQDTSLGNALNELKTARIQTILQLQSQQENARIAAEAVPENWAYQGNVVKNGLIYEDVSAKYKLVTTGSIYQSRVDAETPPDDISILNDYQSARTFAAAAAALYKSVYNINKQIGYKEDCILDFADENNKEEDYLDDNPNSYIKQKEASEEKLTTIKEEKSRIAKVFEDKYRRYVSDGTWSDSSYTDPDKYYLDAERVAATSARPQISYNISAMNLSGLEGYEVYDVDVGDKTFICDEEFFGYTTVDGRRTLYREEVVISEVLEVLDNPSESTVTVQNYRTQFEDLFSRISATVQTVQLNEQVFSRGQNFTPNGEIVVSVLQDTLLNNSFTLSQAVNQNVIINNRGIEVISLTNNAKRLRVVADGIYVSSDGGLTWTAGFQADGMNAAFIKTGAIDTNSVTIRNGSFPSYTWDKLGITAYQTLSDSGDILPLSQSGLVRFDQHGLYLIKTPTLIKTIDRENDKFTGVTDLVEGQEYWIVDDTLSDGQGQFVYFGSEWDGTKTIYEFRNFNGEVKYQFESETEVLNRVFKIRTTGSTSADFGYDSKGNPWYNSTELVLGDEEATSVTWKNRLDYIQDRTLVNLTWRGLRINSNTGSVEIGTDIPVIRIYDNKGGQNKPSNIARVDLGFTEEGIGVPTRGDYDSGSPSRTELIYGLTLRNGVGDTVLKTLGNGSLWLRDSLFLGHTIDEIAPDGTNTSYIFDKPKNAIIGLQTIGQIQSQFSGSTDDEAVKETSNFVFWVKDRNNFDSVLSQNSIFTGSQTGAFPYSFTIDEEGNVTANSLRIASDGYFEGMITAQEGYISGILGIGDVYLSNYNKDGTDNKILVNNINELSGNEEYWIYEQDSEGESVIIPTQDTSYTFIGIIQKEIEEEIKDYYQFQDNNSSTIEELLETDVLKKVWHYPEVRIYDSGFYSGSDGEERSDYAIWVHRFARNKDGDSEEAIIDSSNIAQEIKPVFYVDHTGHLYAEDAEISGHINAESGLITGDFRIGNSSNSIIFDGSNSSIYDTNGKYRIDGTGTITADDLILTGDAEISGHLTIGDTFALLDPPSLKQDGITIYPDGAVILAGDYSSGIYRDWNNNGEEDEEDRNYGSLKAYLQDGNPRYGEEDIELQKISNLVITKNGVLTARSLNIYGEDSTIKGSLTIKNNDNPDSPQIVISGSNGISHSQGNTSLWSINLDGSAIFNNITAKGTISTSVLKYNEIQYSSGAILVRPASKIYKIKLANNVNKVNISGIDSSTASLTLYIVNENEAVYDIDDNKTYKYNETNSPIPGKQLVTNISNLVLNIKEYWIGDTEISLIGTESYSLIRIDDKEKISSVENLIINRIYYYREDETSFINYQYAGKDSSGNTYNFFDPEGAEKKLTEENVLNYIYQTRLAKDIEYVFNNTSGQVIKKRNDILQNVWEIPNPNSIIYKYLFINNNDINDKYLLSLSEVQQRVFIDSEDSYYASAWIWLNEESFYTNSVPSSNEEMYFSKEINGRNYWIRNFLNGNAQSVIQYQSSLYEASKINEYDIGEETVVIRDENGNVVEEVNIEKLKILIDITFNENALEDINKNDYSDFSYLNMGEVGDVGIFINSDSTVSQYGEAEAITIFENTQRYNELGDPTGYAREAKVVLGNLNNIPKGAFSNIIRGDLGDTLTGYGLFADNAYLKGSITTGDSGISTELDNGIVFWGGANSNLHEISFEGASVEEKTDLIDNWRKSSNNISKYTSLPNFFVTDDGFLFAKEGYFAGTIKSDDAEISGAIGIGGLRIADESRGLYVSSEESVVENGEIVVKEKINTVFNKNGLQMYSGGDLEIYRKTIYYNDLPPQGITPYIFSDDGFEGLVSQKLLVSELPDSSNEDKGILLNKDSILFRRRLINSTEDKSYRAQALGGLREEGEMSDYLEGETLASFSIDSSNILNSKFRITIGDPNTVKDSTVILEKSLVTAIEAKVNKKVSTPEVNYTYYEEGDSNIKTVTIFRSVNGGVDVYVSNES